MKKLLQKIKDKKVDKKSKKRIFDVSSDLEDKYEIKEVMGKYVSVFLGWNFSCRKEKIVRADCCFLLLQYRWIGLEACAHTETQD